MVWANTLCDAKYKLKMNALITDKYYSHSSIYPIHGIKQGSSNGPCLWLIISSILCDKYNEKAHGAIFETPDKSTSIQVYLVGFVDDTNGNVNSFRDNVQPPISSLLEKMQHDAQLWNDLLWNSGGALELPKCFYQILHWEFNNGKPLLMGKSKTQLIIKTPSKHEIKVKEKSPYSTWKTLGHHIGTGTKNNTQYKKILEKSRFTINS